MYNRNGQKVKTMKEICSHPCINILSLVIEDTEYLTVACAVCGEMTYRHLDIDAPMRAFGGDRLGPLCYGPDKSILAVQLELTLPEDNNKETKGATEANNDTYCLQKRVEKFSLDRTGEKENRKVMKIFPRFEFNRVNFVYGPRIQTKMKCIFGLCYIINTDILVLSSPRDPALIQAISMKTEEVLWEVKEAEGLECNPHGMVYSHRHNVLLVADGKNKRLLVLQPTGGSCLQTIDVSSQVDCVWFPHIYGDQLIVHHQRLSSKQRLSYYTVRFFMILVLQSESLCCQGWSHAMFTNKWSPNSGSCF